MYKDGIVTVGDWYKGQVKHPIYGFGRLQNVEVFENKGLAKLKPLSYDRGDTLTALPIAEVYDVSGNVYTLTGVSGTGVCYKNGTSIQNGLAAAKDLAIYKNYLWVRYSTVLSCYGPLDSLGAQWFGNVGTGLENDYNGQMVVGQDDFLYITNGNSVAKLEVTASGTVAVAPTISLTLEALDLPDGQYASCMTEFGRNLVIGTHGGGSYFGRGNYPVARLYAWNRQAGTLGNPGLADLPITFNENGINAILQYANLLYISAGTQGSIYESDGTNYRKIATLPYAPIGHLSPSTVYYNAMSISQRGTLMVGLTGYGGEFDNAGLYEIDIQSEGNPVCYQTISTGETGAGLPVTIGFITSRSYQNSNVGWSYNAAYKIDTTQGSDVVDDYGGIIESPLIKVGTSNNAKTFQHIEWTLADPLVDGQSIRISYRLNAKDDYTLIGTWDYDTYGSLLSFQDNAPIADAVFVQLKIELNQDTSTLYGANINLVSVNLF